MTNTALNGFLNPISAKRREIITKKLEEEGITRLTIERGYESQTLRYEKGEWNFSAQRASL